MFESKINILTIHINNKHILARIPRNESTCQASFRWVKIVIGRSPTFQPWNVDFDRKTGSAN